MAEDTSKKVEKKGAPAGDTPQPTQPGIQVVAQYIKDLSFENPNSPESLVSGWPAPDTNVQISLHHHPVKDDTYECVLNFRIDAKKKGEDKVCFLIELAYGALVVLKNVPKENHQPVLMIEVSKLLFPFAREIVANASAHGGYPPLYIAPINFEAIYMQEVQRRKAELEKKSASS